MNGLSSSKIFKQSFGFMVWEGGSFLRMQFNLRRQEPHIFLIFFDCCCDWENFVKWKFQRNTSFNPPLQIYLLHDYFFDLMPNHKSHTSKHEDNSNFNIDPYHIFKLGDDYKYIINHGWLNSITGRRIKEFKVDIMIIFHNFIKPSWIFSLFIIL